MKSLQRRANPWERLLWVPKVELCSEVKEISKKAFCESSAPSRENRAWLGLKRMKAEGEMGWDEQKPGGKQQQIQAGWGWSCSGLVFYPEAAILGFRTKTKTLIQTWNEALNLEQVNLNKF